VVHVPTNWTSRKRIVTLLANIAVGLAWLGLAQYRLGTKDWAHPTRWPMTFDFPLTDYALIALIGLLSFGVTVAGVARQRHGDAREINWTPGTGFPVWLVNLFRFSCPISSPTRAQVWFELKSRGLPVLAIGAVLAIVNPLLFAVSVAIEDARPMVGLFAMFSVLATLSLGGNAFGILWRPGRLWASTFEATQPQGTAWLAGLKVLVRSICMLVALVAVSVSVWASMSFMTVGDSDEPLRGYQPLRSWQGAIEGAVGDLTGYQQVTLAFVVSIGFIVMVVLHAAFKALVARERRRLGVIIAGWLLLLHGLVFVPLVLTGYRGVGSQAMWEFLVGALVWMTRWIDTPAMVFATVYVIWSAFAERLLTLRSACGVVVISAAFGAAWLTTLRAAGVQLTEISPMTAAWMLSPALLPLMASVLAPWSLGRIRHT
jgi:hypothetical protein